MAESVINAIASTISVTPASGVTANPSLKNISGIVVGYLELKLTASANTWTTVGTISDHPINTPQFAIINAATLQVIGVLVIYPTGTMSIKSTVALSNNTIVATVGYSTS